MLPCRDEAEGRSQHVVRASYFGEDYLHVQELNKYGMGNTTEFVALSLDESLGGNATQIRCVMGNSKLHNVLSARAPRTGDNGDTSLDWVKSSVKCCVDRTAPGVVPIPGEEGPIPDKCAGYDWSAISITFDWAFTIAFTVEMFIQFIAKGCYGDKPDRKKHMEGSYFRSPWNWLDFYCCSCELHVRDTWRRQRFRSSDISCLATTENAHRNSQHACFDKFLFKSLPNMQYVILLMLFLPIVFGVIAVQLWGAY